MMNQALYNYIGQQVPMIRDVAQIYESLKAYFPQLNPSTKLDFVRMPEVIIAEKSHETIRALQETYEPKSGLIARFQRLRGRIHKWFVDNQYHPGEKPKNWRPYLVRIGYRVVFPPPVEVPKREIRLQPYGYEYIEIVDRPFNPPKRFYITCGYDPLTDTLFIRR